MRWISWVAKDMLDSQEGLSSMELVDNRITTHKEKSKALSVPQAAPSNKYISAILYGSTHY
jgi:hypothetical protein